MKEKIHLIVLSHTKFGEDSVVLHTLCREYGRKGFLVKVGQKTRPALFQPLNILEAEVTVNPRSDLWWAGSLKARTPLNSIRSDIRKNTMTLFMGEVLFKVVKEGMSEDGLFDWCERTILTLDALKTDYPNYHLRFLLELSMTLGFSPSIEDLAPFAGSHARELEVFLSSPFEQAMLLPLTGEARNEMAGVILRYLEYHTESSINVRSLKVLREIYG